MRKRTGLLSDYAKHAGISKQSMATQLQRLGLDYSKPFNWEETDQLLDQSRHLGRDHLRRRKVTHV